MRFKTLLSAVLIFCFVGCLSDPGDEVINVTRRTTNWLTDGKRVEENLAVKVSDFEWEKVNGVWCSISCKGVPVNRTKPADKEAVEAIEAYMEQ
jgi:integrase